MPDGQSGIFSYAVYLKHPGKSAEGPGAYDDEQGGKALQRAGSQIHAGGHLRRGHQDHRQKPSRDGEGGEKLGQDGKEHQVHADLYHGFGGGREDFIDGGSGAFFRYR